MKKILFYLLFATELMAQENSSQNNHASNPQEHSASEPQKSGDQNHDQNHNSNHDQGNPQGNDHNNFNSSNNPQEHSASEPQTSTSQKRKNNLLTPEEEKYEKELENAKQKMEVAYKKRDFRNLYAYVKKVLKLQDSEIGKRVKEKETPSFLKIFGKHPKKKMKKK